MARKKAADRALEIGEGLCREFPDDREYRRLLAYLRMDVAGICNDPKIGALHDPVRATGLARAAMAEAPPDQERNFRVRLAVIHYRNSNWEALVNDIGSIVPVSPTLDRVWLLIIAHHHLGNRDEAILCYERARKWKQGPSHWKGAREWQKEALELLGIEGE